VETLTPSSSTSEFPAVLDSDRDTTFDDFDLESDERLEVAEMFQSSRMRAQSRRGSESDADRSGNEHSQHFSINIPASYRSLLCPFGRVEFWSGRVLAPLLAYYY